MITGQRARSTAKDNAKLNPSVYVTSILQPVRQFFEGDGVRQRQHLFQSMKELSKPDLRLNDQKPDEVLRWKEDIFEDVTHRWVGDSIAESRVSLLSVVSDMPPR